MHKVYSVDIVYERVSEGSIHEVVLELTDDAGNSTRITVPVRWTS